MFSPATSRQTDRNSCRCQPNFHPKPCLKCQLTHKAVGDTLLRALDIPHRLYLKREIDWQEENLLGEKIDSLVWSTYSMLYTMLTSRDILTYFNEVVYSQVVALLRSRNKIELEQEDEDAFKYAPDELQEGF